MDPAQAVEAQQLSLHRIINETIERGDSPLQKFYEDSVIFITGASGFLGKSLVEKLFRSCKVKKMFLLLRTKKQRSAQRRFREIFKDPVFEYLHKTQPGFTNKIVPVSGDITDPRLGMSGSDWQTLKNEVEIIFHVAATINFVDPLKSATLTNVRGTMEMFSLAKMSKNLRSFVHISTAYAHATPEHNKQMVPEEFMDSPIAPEDLLALVTQYDEHTMDEMTPQILKSWPNTYAFTKAVAEEVTRTMSGNLPVCIVRPAIVVSAYREPTPGWLDKTNVYGPTGFVAGCGLGILHVMNGHPQTIVDLVPVDVVNNAIVAAAQETAARHRRDETDVKIYTVTGTRNPIRFGKLIDTISTKGRLYTPPKAIWYAFGIPINNNILYHILCWFLHYIPGYLVDGVLMLLGKKPMLMKLYKKVSKLNGVYSFYLKHDWTFGDKNLRELYWNLSPTDRTIFNFSMDSIDWDLFIVLWCIGCRKYIYKDGLTGSYEGYKKQLRLRIAHYFIVAVFTLFSFVFVFKLIGKTLGL